MKRKVGFAAQLRGKAHLSFHRLIVRAAILM